MGKVIIIGGGIIGSSIALELQHRKIQTIVLERAVAGAESSSAAAGMLAPQLEAKQADPVFELGLYSRGLYQDWVEQLEQLSEIRVDYHTDGAVQLLMRNLAWQKDRGLRLETLDKQALRARLPQLHPSFERGLFFPDEAQVDPRKLIRALAQATAVLGAEHKCGTSVRKVLIENGRACGVELEDGPLYADRVIVAAGAWSSLIPGVPLPSSSVRPARGQMLALDLGRCRFRSYVWAPDGYLVPRRDGRLLVGATVELVGYNKGTTAVGLHALLSAVLKTMPDLAEAPVVETWSGLRPWTEDARPFIGETEIEGLYLATGHYRNGILQAPGTAKLIADLIEARPTALSLAPFNPRQGLMQKS